MNISILIHIPEGQLTTQQEFNLRQYILSAAQEATMQAVNSEGLCEDGEPCDHSFYGTYS